jgi:Immunoglobulin-like domain of bacterial spore germination
MLRAIKISLTCALMKTRPLLVALALLSACSPPAEKAKQPDASDAIGAGAERAGAGVAREGVASSELTLSKAPREGALVASPISVEGTAPHDWYFEGQFRAQLIDAQGAVLAQAPALPQSDWQKPGPVPFIADLAFDVDADTPATLVLQEDMPAEGRAPREKRIALVLAR